jgi:nicotinate-nucleotide adenylyltransferase
MALAPEIGLLGGSFDPVHRAHIALALAALDTLALDHVELLPAAQPWQRSTLNASPEHRLRMLELACRDEPRLQVNPLELERAGPTYTLDTLRALPQGPRYTWIMGADQLVNFCTWHDWREIIRLVRLAVAQRPGTPLTTPPALATALPAGALQLIPFTARNISATSIRRSLAAGRPANDMLDPRVLDYIHVHQLYRHR